MIETYLRPVYQYVLVDRIAEYTTAFSPKQITYAACLTGILVAPAILLNLPMLATVLLLLSGFLDTLDGSVARKIGNASNLGSVLDIISDRLVEFAVIVGLFAVDPSHRAWMALAMLGSCYLCVTSFLVIGIFTPNHSQKGFYYSPGLIERAEAFIFFILMIWMPDYFHLLAFVFTGLVSLTCYLHLKQFIRFSIKP